MARPGAQQDEICRAQSGEPWRPPDLLSADSLLLRGAGRALRGSSVRAQLSIPLATILATICHDSRDARHRSENAGRGNPGFQFKGQWGLEKGLERVDQTVEPTQAKRGRAKEGLKERYAR